MSNKYANAEADDSGAAQGKFLGGNEPALHTETQLEFQAAVSGTLNNRVCRVGNHVASGRAPVLGMCRELLAQGVNPDAALEVYRNGTLAVRVRTLRQGAALAVEECGDGRPRFRAYHVLSPARKIPRGAP